MIVFCLDDLPFCAVIVVGITSFLAQMLNTASVQAFCSVVSLEGSERGSWTLTDLMFAWPSPWVTSVISVAPFEREVLWLELALNFGANFSALQFATWNGDSVIAVA